MKKILIILLLFSISLRAEKTKSFFPPPDTNIHRFIKNIPFKVGERLEFNVHYGFINAAKSIISVPAYAKVRGNWCYVVKIHNRTNSFFDKIHKVRDDIISYIDYDGLYSWRHEKHLREGSYRSNRAESYFQDEHVVYCHKKKRFYPIEPFCMDAVCALFYLRTVELEPGKDVFFENYTDQKNYSVRVIVHKKEIVETPLGKLKAIKIEPVMKDPAAFNASGRILVWVTDDSLKVPIKLQSKIMIGSFTADLEKYEGVELNFIDKN